jgi:cytochrome b561
VLHWLIAALIIGNLVLVWVIDLLPDDIVRPAIDTHKSLGLTVLGLAILRVLWRATHRPPALPRSYPTLERVGAHAAHALLYVLILGLPLSGWIHDSAFKDAAAHPLTLFGIIPWFRIGPIMALDPAVKEQVHATWFQIHGLLAYALYALLALHILGALKHQFIDKEPEFARIALWRRARAMPGSRPSSRTAQGGP